ncbi:hypothetical protein NDU88_000376 [Pleurodeles waltl]|uniref:Uncharacterized protein n=1 Tax=Pleurodeles waltl TaxID=8319 RepID=A0AAV7MHS5_PLEWA|nr:hypothetical protein NDU88_000376 [Pleurodeles waltl]
MVPVERWCYAWRNGWYRWRYGACMEEEMVPLEIDCGTCGGTDSTAVDRWCMEEWMVLLERGRGMCGGTGSAAGERWWYMWSNGWYRWREMVCVEERTVLVERWWHAWRKRWYSWRLMVVYVEERMMPLARDGGTCGGTAGTPEYTWWALLLR